MTKSFFTHFLVIFLFHVLLILGTLHDPQREPRSTTSRKMGQDALNLQVLSKIMKTSSPRIKSVPLTKEADPRESQKIEQSSVTDGTSSGESSIDHGTNSVRKADILSLYKAELRALIDKNKSYPALSKRLGQTGTVVVAFTLLKDGHIIDVRLDKPSRYERLNFSALDAVKKVERFKPIPNEIGELKMDIKVPVKFVTI